MKNMKTRIGSTRTTEDSVIVSEEGMKKVLFDRIGDEMTVRSKKHCRDSLKLTDSELRRTIRTLRD